MKGKLNLMILLSTVWMCTLMITPQQQAKAAIPIAKIIKEAVKKVIKAFDLMIQRMQTKTIWLQNAQKVLENKLSELKLKEIAEWTEKHRKLYEEYYDELWKIKNILATYQRVRYVMDKQTRLVQEFKRAWNLVRQDKNFSEKEIDYLHRVYSGILQESIRNLEQLQVVINSFTTQMSDAQRLQIISLAGNRIEKNLIDLLEFNKNVFQVSVNRAKAQHEVDRIKKLYGL